MSRRTFETALIAVAMCAGTAGQSAMGAVWTNNNNSTWHLASNWSGGDIANGIGETADFSTINITGTRTVTIDGSQDWVNTVGGGGGTATGPKVGNLIFGDTTPTVHGWTIGTSNSGTLTLEVAAGSPLITVNNLGTGVVTVTAPLAGTQGFTKDGVGVLVLNANNTFSGDINLSGGTVRASTDARLGNAANDIFLTNNAIFNNTGGFTLGAGRFIDIGTGGGTLETGGTLTLANAGQLTGTGTLTKTGTGVLDLQAANTGFTGAINVNAGTLRLRVDPFTEFGTVTVNDGAAISYGFSDTYDAAEVVLSEGAILGAITNGTVLTVDTAPVNSLGGLRVDSSTSSNTTLMTGAATLKLRSGATIDGAGGTITNNLSLVKTTPGNGTLTIGGSSNPITLDGNITSSDSPFDVVKVGGTVNLNGSNALSSLTINAGALNVGHANGLGGGPVSVNAGTLTLNVAVSSAQMQAIAVASGATMGFGGGVSHTVVGATEVGMATGANLLVTGASTLSLTNAWANVLGNVTVGGGSTISGAALKVGDGSTISGNGQANVINSNITMVKTTAGNGTLILSGTGNSAKLTLNGNITSSNQPFDLVVQSSGNARTVELAGINSFNSVMVNNAGRALALSAGALGDGDIFVDPRLGTTSAGSDQSILTLNVAAIADTASVFLTSGQPTDLSNTFFGKVSIAAGVEDMVAALYFNGVSQAFGTYGSTASTATFKNDDWFAGTGVLLVAIPEPASLALLAIGGVLLLPRRRGQGHASH